MSYDFKKILELAEKYKPQMSKFLRDMIAIPSESCDEKKVIERIAEEMKAVGFDKMETDPMGNVLGYIGHGKHLIAMDGHVDTVGVGNPKNWEYDPYRGYEDDEIIVGRGASDQEGGMASMVYAGKIIKDLKLEDDFTLLITGTVQEEDCDGLCWQYIIKELNIRPEFVVLTEPTSCRIYRGHRGRMEIKVTTQGVSCHGSAPERGDFILWSGFLFDYFIHGTACNLVVPQMVSQFSELVEYNNIFSGSSQFPGLVIYFLYVALAARSGNNLTGNCLEPFKTLLAHVLRQYCYGAAAKQC
jgi:acetylornithine deacetylase/succinyl-diaminopimelate desuccinylase-like protein